MGTKTLNVQSKIDYPATR